MCRLSQARIAGLLYLLLTPLGIFGIIYVPSVLIVSGDMSTTVSNIISHELLFRSSIVSALLVQILNIAVVFALYKLLKPVNRTIAISMVIFLLLGVPIAMLNELTNVAVLLLIDGSSFLTAFTSLQIEQTVSVLLEAHHSGVMIASIFWGLWLMPMGYLVFKSGAIPKILGILLMIGSLGYLADVVIFFLFPDLDLVLSEFTFLGELLFPLWLLIRGATIPSSTKTLEQ